MPHRQTLSVALLVAAASAMASAQGPNIGATAPTIKCKDHRGVETSFPPAGSWAVLAFYPKAATPG